MIAADCRFDFVAAPQTQRSHQVRRYVRIASLGEVAELRPANEAGVSLRIEPTGELSLCYDRCGRFLGTMFTARTATAALVARVTSTTLPACVVITAMSSVPAAPAPASLILLACRCLWCRGRWAGSIVGAAGVGALAVVGTLLDWRRSLRRARGRWRCWRCRRRAYAVGVSIALCVFVLL
jgi:hypothetical protein